MKHLTHRFRVVTLIEIQSPGRQKACKRRIWPHQSTTKLFDWVRSLRKFMEDLIWFISVVKRICIGRGKGMGKIESIKHLTTLFSIRPSCPLWFNSSNHFINTICFVFFLFNELIYKVEIVNLIRGQLFLLSVTINPIVQFNKFIAKRGLCSSSVLLIEIPIQLKQFEIISPFGPKI